MQTPQQARAPEAVDTADAHLDLEAARAQVDALDVLLQEEFDALRQQQFDRLETLQNSKVALLESLQVTAKQVAALPEPQRPALWSSITLALAASRETFRRNEQLVARQVEVVRNTLRALQAADPTASVDLYDRLGQMSRRGGRRLFSEA
jgi:flagellar biosynthesis/type III secretory pathway chaperone